jgi:hypothetical protein
MSDKTETDMNDASQVNTGNQQQDVDLQELAEKIVKLLQQEIELENLRTGKNY